MALVATVGTGCGPEPAAPVAHEGPKATLRAASVAGRPLPDGAELSPDDLLVFGVAGAGDGYFMLLEQAGERLAVIHPAFGQVVPAQPEEQLLRPQPPWLLESEPELPGWRPGGWGELTYLLVVTPTPRDAPSGRELVALEQLLAPPPYVRGPAAERAAVAARLTLRRPIPEGGIPPEEVRGAGEGSGSDGSGSEGEGD